MYAKIIFMRYSDADIINFMDVDNLEYLFNHFVESELIIILRN